MPVTTTKATFGTCPNGGEAHIFTLCNSNNETVELTDIGAAIRSITVPDKSGRMLDVSLCYGSFPDSVTNSGSFGAVCGRVANRISNARFTLNGKVHELVSKVPDFQLHGGIEGFSSKLWDSEIVENGVKFTLHSPDGDQGYPGALDVSITYTWSDDRRLGMDYHAVSDADTIINLTNHAYFNLNGHDAGDILGHTAVLDCDEYLPVKPNVCVTGEIRNVKGTNMDFTAPHTFGERIYNDDDQLKYAGGYDFCYVIRGEGYRRFAAVTGDKSGITLNVYTDKPSVHLYTGNNINEVNGKNGAVYDKYHGFCLETQFFPDAINQPTFTPPILRKGEEYSYKTVFEFS